MSTNNQDARYNHQANLKHQILKIQTLDKKSNQILCSEVAFVYQSCHSRRKKYKNFAKQWCVGPEISCVKYFLFAV